MLANQQMADGPDEIPIAVDFVAERFHENTNGKRSGNEDGNITVLDNDIL
ncbi:hypothetical protein [Brevibacillus choshinensis]|nr:hypothetical protein [Brevibacillus choshinensis]